MTINRQAILFSTHDYPIKKLSPVNGMPPLGYVNMARGGIVGTGGEGDPMAGSPQSVKNHLSYDTG